MQLAVCPYSQQETNITQSTVSLDQIFFFLNHFAFLFCSNFLPILLLIVPILLFITPILLFIKSCRTNQRCAIAQGIVTAHWNAISGPSKSTMPILLNLLYLTAHFASKLLTAFKSLFCSKFCQQIWSRPSLQHRSLLLLDEQKCRVEVGSDEKECRKQGKSNDVPQPADFIPQLSQSVQPIKLAVGSYACGCHHCTTSTVERA